MKPLKFLLFISVLLNFSCTEAQKNMPSKTTTNKNENIECISIGQKFKIDSKILSKNKEVYISLPHKYNEHIQSYPVVFVVEAELLFEPTKAITTLMAARSKMPQAIIVGIPNEYFNERHEMTFEKWGGKPKLYLDFFKKELIPYIEENYRANSHRTLIAMSPTNGLLFEAFLKQPDIFSGYIALTMHWDWNPENNEVIMVDKLIETITDPSYPKATIYFGTADDDMRFNGESFEEANEKLNQLSKTSTNVSFKVEKLPEDEHYLMALSGLRNGFKLMYPHDEWKFIRLSDFENPIEEMKTHYDRLSTKHGFEVYPLEDSHGHYSLVGWAYNYGRRKEKYSNQQLIDLLNFSIEYYPNSANLQLKLAEAYKLKGNKELSVKTAEKAMKLAGIYHPEELESFKKEFEKLRK